MVPGGPSIHRTDRGQSPGVCAAQRLPSAGRGAWREGAPPYGDQLAASREADCLTPGGRSRTSVLFLAGIPPHRRRPYEDIGGSGVCVPPVGGA
jgi:hypothetical protein